jgi:tRNA(Arg) A34 adenosine deaminase TadA
MHQDPTRPEIERYLRMAMEEAEKAARAGNHPYGAIIVDPEGAIAATGRNGVETDHDPASHAELNAIRQACRERQTLSLEGYRLYTNGAPCTMCATAIVRTGIAEVWYSAPADPGRSLPTLEELVERSGAVTPQVNQGLLADEASAQLARWST